jgi:hypothetical protein
MSATKGCGHGAVHRLYRLYRMKRWIYRAGRPRRIAVALNRVAAIRHSAGILWPARAATLEVAGRRAGHLVPFAVVVAEYGHERYLVSMLGNDANWVRDVRAAHGCAVLRRGRREQVRLEEVEPAGRAPILRRYLAVAPGARPYLPVDRHAPLGEFERIAAQFPVFRIIPAATAATSSAVPGEPRTAGCPGRRLA